MQVQDRVPVEADFGRVADEKLHCVLVIENHLGFEPVPTFRLLAELDEPIRARFYCAYRCETHVRATIRLLGATTGLFSELAAW